jgi:hypothetical protein
MIDIERRLEESASEIRERTKGMTPTVIVPRRFRVRQGWVAMATGFAMVVVVVGLVPLLRGGGTEPGGDPGTTSPLAPVATTAPAGPLTTVGSAPVNCPAAGMAQPGSQAGLPEAVATARDGIASAAIACDWDRLAEYAVPDFVSSFGGGDFGDMLSTVAMEVLLPLLNTPYGIVDSGESRIFVWPSAFAYETWDEVPDEDLQALDSIYKEDLYEIMIPSSESYLGWRIGITEQGEWLYFVAGD